MATKYEVLQEQLKAWKRAVHDKKKRGEIIQTICSAVHMNPKSVPRAMRRLENRDGTASGSAGGRPRIYTNDCIAALKDVWELGDRPCGELLHPMIPEYVEALQRCRAWPHTDVATAKLLAMSERSVKRYARALQKKYGMRRGASSTKSSALKSVIPIFKGPWRDLPPGTGQIDTVAHCGNTLLGDFLFTVNYTDTATYWVIPRAQWNKGRIATMNSLNAIVERLPVPLSMIHPDSGSEFINRNLLHWCKRNKVRMTRSEPGKKNDNMYVEERNGHVVRKYLGYARFDNPEIVPVVNELYEALACYLNHFKAVRRQVSKEKVGSKYVRKYEKRAATPYARLIAHPDIPEETRNCLREEHNMLNPLHLKKCIDTLRMKIHYVQQTTRERKGISS